MRRVVASFLLFGAVLAGGMGVLSFEGRTVSACSRQSIMAQYIPDAVAVSQVVAIGTFEVASERTASLRVDEGLLGAEPGQLLQIDNRTSYTGMACSPYDEPFQDGYRFRVGDRRIVILETEVDGIWQVGFYSDTAWEVPEDELAPMITDFWNDGRRPPSLTDVRAEIRNAPGLLGSDLAFESRGPCNAVEGLETRIAASTAVIVADIEPGAEFATARIREVIAGEVEGQSIKLNHRTRRSYDTCDVVLEPARDVQYPAPGRYLVFLRPDEFGVGDYRIAYWGYAILEANERYVTEGLPTLRDVREAVAASEGGSSSASSGPNDDAWWPALLAVAAMVGVLVVWVGVLPRRR